MMQPTQVELTAPHVEVIPGATAARLEQARQLAAAHNWDEAIDIYRELAADKSDRVVALDGNRYLSLRNYCHLQIARLPAEGLAAYRRRVDASAEQLYRDGLANRDEAAAAPRCGRMVLQQLGRRCSDGSRRIGAGTGRLRHRATHLGTDQSVAQRSERKPDVAGACAISI